MHLKTTVSFLLANSLAITGVGAADVSNSSQEAAARADTTALNTLLIADDETILLYVDSSTGAYLGEHKRGEYTTQALGRVGIFRTG